MTADYHDFALQAVSFDLDDTLLHTDLSVSPYSVGVFRRLAEEGICVIPASGRAKLSMKPYIDQLACASVYISCNGAEIWKGDTHELLFRELFSEALSWEIAAFAEENDCYAQVYKGDSFYYNKYGIFAERYASSSRLKGHYVGDLRSFIREPRNKILMIAEESKIAEMLQKAKVQFEGRASVTCSKPFYLEFNPLNATKGNALRWAASYLGVDVANTAAFGDSLNDLSMLNAAGLAVSVANGWKEIIPFCDAVCGSNDDDGPARFLDEHFPAKEVLS